MEENCFYPFFKFNDHRYYLRDSSELEFLVDVSINCHFSNFLAKYAIMTAISKLK